MKIYTKKGDFGETDLAFKRIQKSSNNIEILALIDEISVLLMKFNLELDIDFIQRIYYNLYLISSELHLDQNLLKKSEIEMLENEIDDLAKDLPNLTSFIVLSGNQDAIEAFYLRAKIRILETKIYGILKPEASAYINRLSDYFFILGRYINYINKIDDVLLKIRKE